MTLPRIDPKLRAAIAAILAGPNTAGRRFVERMQREEPPPYGPQSAGAAMQSFARELFENAKEGSASNEPIPNASMPRSSRCAPNASNLTSQGTRWDDHGTDPQPAGENAHMSQWHLQLEAELLRCRSLKWSHKIMYAYLRFRQGDNRASWPGNITGEAKHEAIEQLLDEGYLRLKIGPRNRRGQFKYYMELWNGQSYQMVGRGRSR